MISLPQFWLENFDKKGCGERLLACVYSKVLVINFVKIKILPNTEGLKNL